MSSVINDETRVIKPTRAESKLALESGRKLSGCLKSRRKLPLRFQIEPEDGSADPILIPRSAMRLLAGILNEMGRGNAVTVVTQHQELTTQQAADILGVSRPFIIDQMDKGLLPYRKIGSHRRTRHIDLMTYKQKINNNRLNALDELSEIDQKHGLGY